MNKFATLLIISPLLIHSATAQQRSSSDVPVKGYYRHDGTYVQPHTRSAPDHTRSDNFSTRGNTNPYTLEPGTAPLTAPPPLPSFSYRSDSENETVWYWGGGAGGAILLLFLFWKSARRQTPVPNKTVIESVPLAAPQPWLQKKPRVRAAKRQAVQPKGGICSRCKGSGVIPRFKHVNGGCCFKCNGTGIIDGAAGLHSTRPAFIEPPPTVEDYQELIDEFDRDEICDPDLQENWDEEHRQRYGT